MEQKILHIKRFCPLVNVASLLLALLSIAAESLQAQSLVISEINYHPLDCLVPPGGTTVVDGDEFEFLEIRNLGASSVDLMGCSVSGGITYTFTSSFVLDPAESVVIVENETFFPVRYPWVTNIAPGEYGGKLSNGGELLVLKNSSGIELFSVSYDDEGDWPGSADGDGRSLMLVNPTGDPNDPSSWCASAELHGSPAATGTCHFTDVVLNEVLAHSDPPLEDAIELLNLSGTAVNLEGWYLSDDFINPKKYRISGSVISSGGYTVFYEYQFNAGISPFALSSLGDELILTAPFPDDDRLRLVDRLNFGATATDVSLGRFPNGTGGFTTLGALTFGTVSPSTVEEFRTGGGAPNSTPRVGPVVINEIMYHPYQDDDTPYEYIELLNVSDTAYDISGWVLDGVNFTNPPGTVISPGEFLVVCADYALISNAYGIANVIGDWPGVLQNGGERIDLLTDEGAVIDSVRYNDKDPWPVGADGYGPSLEKMRSAENGDTYINWNSSRSGIGWQYVAVTQSVSSTGTDNLKFWLDHEGKCYIDDVSVQPLGGGSELITDGDFELGGSAWAFVGNHEYSRVEAGAGRNGSSGLVLVGNFTRIVEEYQVFVYYGSETNDHVVSGSYSLPAGDYILSYWIRRGPTGLNLNFLFDGAVHEYQLGSYGSPGTANSTSTELSLIGVEDVLHRAMSLPPLMPISSVPGLRDFMKVPQSNSATEASQPTAISTQMCNMSNWQ